MAYNYKLINIAYHIMQRSIVRSELYRLSISHAEIFLRPLRCI